MPYHDGYSDSVFMGTVIAAQAGALTGDRKYFDLAARHVAFMQKLVLRPDGLYRHSPQTRSGLGTRQRIFCHRSCAHAARVSAGSSRLAATVEGLSVAHGRAQALSGSRWSLAQRHGLSRRVRRDVRHGDDWLLDASGREAWMASGGGISACDRSRVACGAWACRTDRKATPWMCASRRHDLLPWMSIFGGRPFWALTLVGARWR